jgi:hypothetical protein
VTVALTHGIGCGCTRCSGFPNGNTAAVRSGFWASPLLRPDDQAEVAEIAASVRELLPVHSPGFEPAIEQLACRIWRQRRAYADLADKGVVRDGQPAPILADLAKLERAIARDLDAFGLTPRAAVALGVDVLRGQAGRLTVTRLARLVEEEENGGER